MQVAGRHYRTIWWDSAAGVVRIVDQSLLPHEFTVAALGDLDQVCEAIRTMRLRGAPLIGAAAAYGLALALGTDPSPASEERAAAALLTTRPTAVNLAWAVRRVRAEIAAAGPADKAAAALAAAERICDEDAAACSAIGDHGLGVLRALVERGTREPGRLNVLTHCNAGWLATVDWGTALAAVYKAHEAGLPLHVWVDETRPRRQGASLTAWELGQQGIPHTLVADSAAGHLLQRGRVDACLVGSDRTTGAGDVCNKIGTYLVALAAHDSAVPFYAAVPVSSIDFGIRDGVAEIPIEERDAREVTEVCGRAADGHLETVTVAPPGTRAANFAFDVTPARLVTALITERGVFPASERGLAELRARLGEAALRGSAPAGRPARG
jgi:methylthioribose-1-phosphate isomerase